MAGRKETFRIAYEEECNRQKHPYEQWILMNETTESTQGISDGCILYLEDFLNEREQTMERLHSKQGTTSFVLLVSKDGVVAPFAVDAIEEYDKAHPEVSMLYADEDELKGEQRCNPWFKPDFSPDTLRSFFYFGHVIAVRWEILIESLRELQNTTEYEQFFRDIIARYRIQVGHVDQILFHYNGSDSKENIQYPKDSVLKKNQMEEKVSVIIPSKDHPQLLRQCILSMKQKTDYQNYEIIVVDNGSNRENKEEVQKLQKEFGFIYQYEEQSFNFSRMCNQGAKLSWGRVLIFLNDDIEIIHPEWMAILAGEALRPHTGAVGAKLYYPDSRRIQHVGITNMGVGPAHKLGGVKDQGSIYHARNLANYNVIAVTGACLAIEKKKFDLTQGFPEELPVAYNDVDLCFSLVEHGWYNVIRNDVTLYHHESVSRGTDDDTQKKERLLSERRLLYRRHPKFYRADPYYSKHLVQDRLDVDYTVNQVYDYENPELYSAVASIPYPKENKNWFLKKLLHRKPVFAGNVDRIEKKYVDFLMQEGEYTEIEGWCAPTSIPGYLKKKVLVLKDMASQCYTVSVFCKYRPDTKVALPKQNWFELSGFVARIEQGQIPPGNYLLQMMLVDERNGRQQFLDLNRSIDLQ